MWMSTFETPNYLFQAFGETKEEAESLLIRAWNRHCKVWGEHLRSYIMEYWGDVVTQHIHSGDVYVDGELVSWD